jgi:hypothetical protein
LQTLILAVLELAWQGSDLGFCCIKGTQSEQMHQFDVRIDHGVSA